MIRTIVKHTARVNTVKWIMEPIPESKNSAQFISGADDNNCLVYTVPDVFAATGAVTVQSLSGHSAGVKSVEARYVEDNLLVATASADETLKLWKCSADSVECFQTIDFKVDLCFAIRLCHTNTDLVLAVASGDKIILYKRQPLGDGQFECVQTLTGHEDWVRGLDFIPFENEYLLASSSQDSFIRIWKSSDASNVLQPFALESVLSGHDGWVYSVQWTGLANGSLQLLSCSMDKTMILWELRDAIWMERVRVGDIGGHFLGFFGAKMSPSKTAILGHGFHGSFHLWNVADPEECSWSPGYIVGGHFGEVRDIGWSPDGEYLLSVSADQTTRIHGQYQKQVRLRKFGDYHFKCILSQIKQIQSFAHPIDAFANQNHPLATYK